MPGAPDSSGPSFTSEGPGEPPAFSVRSMLAALRPQQLAAGRPQCDATLSVYPGFELLTAMVVNQTDAICPIGVENRQFLPEFFLLQSFLSHPCRVPHRQGARPLGSGNARPHFYVIPVLWRALSLLCQTPSVRRRRAARAAGCPLARTAAALVSSLVNSSLFRFDAEHHILLHTSTAARVDLWGWDALANALSDPRVIALHFEGRGGDARAQAYRPSSRTIPVPYFVEPQLGVTRELRQWAGRASLQLATAQTGSGARVFLRSSAAKGAAQRTELVAAFAGQQDADVAATHGVARFDRKTAEEMRATFLATTVAMGRSTFCLVPSGITATTRRLYEALSAGCVPVLLSARFTLPFSRVLNWSAALINASAVPTSTLPALLRGISQGEIARLRRAGAALSRHVSYTDGDAAELTWNEIVRLGYPNAAHKRVERQQRRLLPPPLLDATRRHGTLVLTVCASSAGYRINQKRQTLPRDCARWLRSLRAHYSGAAAIAMGGTPDARLKLAASADLEADGQRRTWLLPKLESRLPTSPPAATEPAATLRGNQLRLVWYATILSELHEADPAASVLAVDARDLLFQANPMTALRAAAPAPCRLRLVADCTCAARNDSYFSLWGTRCLPPPLLAALGDDPPINGGVVFGAAGAMRALYAKAAVLATSASDEAQYVVSAARAPLSPRQCVAGGREQHLITGAAYALAQLHPRDVCTLPNALERQTAAFNLGVNNRVSTLRLNEATGRLESPGGRAIAIVHQYDRRAAVKAFLRRHHVEA